MSTSKFKISNKVLSVLLCLALLLSYVPLSPLTVNAAEFIEVDTAEELVLAMKSGGLVKLAGNIDMGNTCIILENNIETTLDLNNYAITFTNYPYTLAICDATLTVTGKGSIKNSEYGLFYLAGSNSKLTIESGYFEANEQIVYVSEGEAALKGGTFKVGDNYDAIYYKPQNTNDAILTITGGSYSSDPWDYTADGYVSKLDDETDYYIVVESDLSKTYNVNIATAQNGTVTADMTAIPAGKIVTLTVKPTETFVLDTLTVMQGDTPVAVTNKTFKMPAGDVTVTATFKEIDTTTITGLYITVNGIKYESSTAENPVVINSDSDATVTVYGYKFDTLPSYGLNMKNAFDYFGSNFSYLFKGSTSWTYDTTSTPNTATKELEISIIKENATTTAKELFYTNDQNATQEGSGIYVIYKLNTYNVNIAQTAGGTVTANVAYAESGDDVTLTVTPDNGNVLYRLTATDANGNTVPVISDTILGVEESGDATLPVFKMPASDVTVTAEFVAADALPDTVYLENSYSNWDAVVAFSDPYGNSISGNSLQLVAGGIYSVAVPDGATGIVFGDLSEGKITAIQWLPTDGNDLFTPGSEPDVYYTGSWSKYSEGTPALPRPLYIKTDLEAPLISFCDAGKNGLGSPMQLTAVSDGVWSFISSVPEGAVNFEVYNLNNTKSYFVKIPTAGSVVNLYNTAEEKWYIYVPTYTITAEAFPADGGVVSGSGDYTQGASVTLMAAPVDGYRFINWTENSVEVSTNESYAFTATGNRKLVANFETSHSHQWTYTAKDNTITAICDNVGCTTDDGGYVTIAAPSSLTYTGSKIEAVVDDKLTTCDTVTVTYTGDTTDGYPVNAGEYIASITLGGETISVKYTIEKATPTANDFDYTTSTDLTCDDTDKEAIVTIKDGIVGMGEIKVMYFRYASDMWIDNEKAPRYPGKYKVGIWLNEGKNYKGVSSDERIWCGDEFEIVYLETSAEAAISGTKGSNGWYTSAVALTAPNGYTISNTVDGTYGDSIIFDDEQNETVTYYLKNVESGKIAQKTVELKIDLTQSSCEHREGEVIIDTAPTCTENGLGHTVCTKEGCGEVVRSAVIISALGHKYKSEVTVAATYSQTGIRTYTCTREECGDQYTKIIPKKSSSSSSSSTTNPPTTEESDTGDLSTEEPETGDLSTKEPETGDLSTEEPDSSTENPDTEEPDSNIEWKTDENGTYYEKEDGTRATGWYEMKKGVWYYFNSNGYRRTGWVKYKENWYYLSESGAMKTGWVKVNGAWYYLSEDGSMKTGWYKDGATWYYFNVNGAMKTGWLKEQENWYYLSESGAMKTGWHKDRGIWYYLSESGAMKTGWYKDGNTWYYLSESGAMQTGWIKLGTDWFYLNADGSMAVDTYIERWYVDKDGYYIPTRTK